jgi:hypothetical protein
MPGPFFFGNKPLNTEADHSAPGCSPILFIIVLLLLAGVLALLAFVASQS